MKKYTIKINKTKNKKTKKVEIEEIKTFSDVMEEFISNNEIKIGRKTFSDIMEEFISKRN